MTAFHSQFRQSKDVRDGMIKLVRLNGEVIYLNYFQILFLEQIPETKVKMANGDYYLVKDSVESIILQTQEFIHSCALFRGKVKDSQEMRIHDR